MKIARFVLKIVALSLASAALICAVIAYWDKIVGLFQCAGCRLQEKKNRVCYASEYDDYVE